MSFPSECNQKFVSVTAKGEKKIWWYHELWQEYTLGKGYWDILFCIEHFCIFASLLTPSFLNKVQYVLLMKVVQQK